MEINIILKKVINILSDKAIAYLDYKLPFSCTYDDIVNLWYYHITSNKLYRQDYIRPAYNSEMLKKIINYRKYYSPKIKELFEIHGKIEEDNILLFFIKNQDKLLLFFKNNDIIGDPFIKLYIPLSKINKIDILDVEDNIVRILLYKKI